MKRNQMSKTGLVFASCLIGGMAFAEVITNTSGYVTLTANDAASSSSFNSSGHWSDSAKPSSGKKYLVQSGGHSDWFTANSFLLRSPGGSKNTETFGGDSLTFDCGAMNMKCGQKGVVKANWILYNCRLSHGSVDELDQDNEHKMYFEGPMEIHGTGDAPSCFCGSGNAGGRMFGVRSALTGDENAVIRVTRSPSDGDDWDGARFRCFFSGNNSNYKGRFILDRGNSANASTDYVLQFSARSSLGSRPAGLAEPFLTAADNTVIRFDDVSFAITDNYPIQLGGNVLIEHSGNNSGLADSDMSGKGYAHENIWFGRGAKITGSGSSVVTFKTATASIALGDVTLQDVAKIRLDATTSASRFYEEYDNPTVPVELVSGSLACSSDGLGPVTVVGEGTAISPGFGTGGLGRFTMSSLTFETANATLKYSLVYAAEATTGDFIRVTGNLTKPAKGTIKVVFDATPDNAPEGARYPLLSAANLGTDVTADDFEQFWDASGDFSAQHIKGTFEIADYKGSPTLFFVQSCAKLVTLTGIDSDAPTSFDSKGSWSDGAAPSSDKDYAVPDGKLLRCRTANGVFKGNSLYIGKGGDFAINGVTTTVNDLRLCGGGFLTVRGDGHNNALNGAGYVYSSANDPFSFEIESPANVARSLKDNLVLSGPGDVRFRYYIGKEQAATSTSPIATYYVNAESPNFTGGIELYQSAISTVFANELAMGGPAASFRADRLLFTSNSTLRVTKSYVMADSTRGITFGAGKSANAQDGGTISVDVGQYLTISNRIAGTTSFRKKGAGLLRLACTASAFSGTMRNLGGTLAIASADALANATLDVHSDALWQVECAEGMTVKNLAAIVPSGSSDKMRLSSPILDGLASGSATVTLLRVKGAKEADVETLLSRVSVETTRKNLILTCQTKMTDGALLLTAKGNLPGLSIIIR